MTTGYRDHRGHADLWLDGCCQLNRRREALAQDEDRRRLDEAGAAERFAMVQAELVSNATLNATGGDLFQIKRD